MYNSQYSSTPILFLVLFRNRRSVSDVFLGFSEAKPKQSNQCKKKNNQTNQPKHRQKRQDSIDALSYTTTEDIGKI
jgi:hypothetical protein